MPFSHVLRNSFVYHYQKQTISTTYSQMGSSFTTRKCPRCRIELYEDNMMIHTRDCVNATASGKLDGSWECTYNGPSSGVSSMPAAIQSARHEALDFRNN